MVRAMILLTSASDMNGHKTGYWLEECAAPYYAFLGAGFDVDLVSVNGGAPPLDEGSKAEGFLTADTKKFLEDTTAQEKVASTMSVGKVLEDGVKYDLAFCVGGHGAVVDFTTKPVKDCLEKIYQDGGVISSVCHGVGAFVGLTDTDGTTPLVKDKNVTGFSNKEEEMVQLTKLVPFSLEDELVKKGAKYTSADAWGEYAVVDGRIVTGQNPQSSKICAEKSIETVKAA